MDSRTHRPGFRHRSAAAAGLSLGLFFASCGPAGTCTTDAQCGGVAICTPSHTCASLCATDAHCGPGERCSTGGVCQRPEQLGAPAKDAGSLSCGGQRFTATRTESNMLVVLDHSGSMMEQIQGVTKWDSAAAAVRSVTSRYGQTLRFGLSLFSNAAAVCHTGSVVVPVGTSTAQAISSALPMDADGNMTPIAGALQVASADPALHDAARANHVMLLTDGMENCGGDPVAQVRSLFGQGVKTYVVGFGAQVDLARLDAMAVEGGTARLGARKSYQVDEPAMLDAALAAIASSAAACDFALAQRPPDPGKLFVAIDGSLVPNDPARRAGYSFDPVTNRLALHGPACDAYANTPGAKLSVVYGCPDETLIEVGPGGRRDGGIDFGLGPTWNGTGGSGGESGSNGWK